MKSARPAACFALFATFAAFAAGAARADVAAADAAFARALAGDSTATGQAVAAYAPLAATDAPEAPLYQAYLGAAQAMQGRDAWMPWNKIKATERGLDTLDKALRRIEPRHDTVAVHGVPVSLEARLVAATSFVAVPDAIFHRADQGRQLLQAILRSPLYALAPPAFRERVETQVAKAKK